MLPEPDIAVYSKAHQLQLVVEVKSMANADPRWAASYRQNLLEHGVVPPSPFFLMVLIDRMYLWVNGRGRGETSLPDYQEKTSVVLERYLPEPVVSGEGVSGFVLEFAVRDWLSDLTSDGATIEDAHPPALWLSDSGLLDAIRHGAVRSETLA